VTVVYTARYKCSYLLTTRELEEHEDNELETGYYIIVIEWHVLGV